MKSEEKYYNEYVTNNSFVTPEYRTHSQATELYMTQPGLDFHKFNPGEKIKEAATAAKKFIKQKESKNNIQNIKTLSLRK